MEQPNSAQDRVSTYQGPSKTQAQDADETSAPIPNTHLPFPQSTLSCGKSTTPLTDGICDISSDIKKPQKLLGSGEEGDYPFIDEWL